MIEVDLARSTIVTPSLALACFAGRWPGMGEGKEGGIDEELSVAACLLGLGYTPAIFGYHGG